MKNMKKILFLLIFVLVLSGCGKENLENIERVTLSTGSSSYYTKYEYSVKDKSIIYSVGEGPLSYQKVLSDVEIDNDELLGIIQEYEYTTEEPTECEGEDGCSEDVIIVEYEENDKKYYIATKDKDKAIEKLEKYFEELFDDSNTIQDNISE